MEGPARARDPLSAYTVNLTEEGRAGRLDPLIGRTRELQRTMEILCRRRKNNPVFVGEAGVGKTALAKGWPCAFSEPTRSRCPRRSREPRSSPSTPGRSSPGPGIAATSRRG